MSPIRNTSRDRQMLKRILFALFVVAVSLSVMSASAEASIFKDYASIYMTASENDTTEVTGDFAWDTKPWVYIQLKDTTLSSVGSSLTASKWTWDDPASKRDPSYLQMEYSQRDNNLWISFSDSQWNSIKKAGFWDVDAASLFHPEGSRNLILLQGSTGFRVAGPITTPEPVSAALFLIGGVALSTRRFFKKKK